MSANSLGRELDLPRGILRNGKKVSSQSLTQVHGRYLLAEFYTHACTYNDPVRMVLTAYSKDSLKIGA